ncbi:MBL fold metallo-hydrolase [Streptomyces rubradiris]|uniref:MBL fold metallo-hydrolase n=1 Tax=Streptomyces rubradiris TaxID=285531 RepID=A0ABQ3RHX3_STRRR|nr:MBL fold metallo-hydrolase [Streptomyces rubradiris]GHH20952.1 MBL fold metallo-hydrolase [Streptomyces rubradiris]GHI55463.1 MBL fold metallo-hydrolase [Streptomyces rubradiris]
MSSAAHEPVLQEVAADVFAYLQPEGGWCVSNAGLIASGGSTALIDTAATEARAQRLRQKVLADGRPAPFALVNTHSHGDHTFGNFLFPEATVIAHANARDEMDRAGLHLTELWPDVAWGGVEVRLPAVTYRDRLTLHVGEVTAELLHFGPSHTANDTVVWIPERKVLFTGDIVMSGFTPFVPLGSVSGSLKVIQQLRELGATTVVTGHGPVAGPEVLDVTEEYLRWVWQLAADGIAAGQPPLTVAREADLGRFAELGEPERLVANLHRAYAEQRTPEAAFDFDVLLKEMGIIFGEMMEYHGGPLTCCA